MNVAIYSDHSPAPLSIHSIGFSDDPKVTHFGPCRRNQFILHFVLRGKGFFNDHPLKTGEGFLIRPMQEEEYHSDPQDPWEFLWVISTDPTMETIFRRFSADPNTHIFHFSFLPTIEATLPEISRRHNQILDSLKILELFLHWVNAENQTDTKKPNAELYLDFCVHYVEANLHHPLPVSELLEKTGVSQPYLYRIFHQQLHTSPQQYILNQKLLTAKKLLRETDLTITQIANATGFTNVTDFSKTFRKKEKISPTKYRKSFPPKASLV